MASTTVSQFTEAFADIKSVFDVEFAAEGYVLVADKVHASLGSEGARFGLAPVEDHEMPVDVNSAELEMELRFIMPWNKKWAAGGSSLPNTQVDPSAVTVMADRFKVAMRTHNHVTARSGLVWYHAIKRTTFPDDPTGNKTRFFMYITSTGNNVSHIGGTYIA